MPLVIAPGLIVLVALVVLIVVLAGRQEQPPLTPTRTFLILAALCFAFATLGVPWAPWLPLGLFCLVAAQLVSPR